MSNPLFTEVSAKQQETVAGGIGSLNLSLTTFVGLQTASGTSSSSGPTGSITLSENALISVDTSGGTANGLDLPDDFDLGSLFSGFFGA